MAAIAVYTGNQTEIATLGRIINTEIQFNNETLRIMLGCLTPGLRGTDAFIDRNLTKWSLRINRVWDMGVETSKALEVNRVTVGSERETERLLNAMDVDSQVAATELGKTDGLLRWSTTGHRWVPGQKIKGVVDEGEEVDEGGEGDEDPVEPSSPNTLQEMTRLPTKRSPLARLIQGSMLNSSKVNHGALCTLPHVQRGNLSVDPCLWFYRLLV